MIFELANGIICRGDEISTFSFRVVYIKEASENTIESGYHALTNDGRLLGKGGTEDPPKPCDNELEAVCVGRDYA